MKVHKKVSSGVGFARKAPYEYEGVQYEADLKNGDKIRIMDGGNIEPGNYGEQTNFKIKTRNGEKKLAFNQATINVLIEEFGDDTENWVGKDVLVILQKKLIGGKKSIVSYLVTPGWSLDEYGELVNGKTDTQQDADGDDETPPDDAFDNL